MDLERIREELLLATLPHVAFDGWTLTAMGAGAADAGLDQGTWMNACPGGPAELIAAFSAWADRRALATLETLDLDAMRVRDRIAAGVRARLEVLAPHREAVRRGLAFLALPQNAALAMTCLYRSVDSLWYAAGDRATDYNFYSKRLLLAGVLSSTAVYWLNDRSQGAAQTWAFLDRRIDEVLTVGGRLGKVMGDLLDLPDRLMAGRARSGALRR
jgi:ubiquinone biosynthesis protein COQ9